MKSSKNNIWKIAGIALVVFGIIFGVITLTQNWGKRTDTVDSEAAVKKLNSLYSQLNVNTLTPKNDPDYLGSDETAEKIAVLPDISDFPFIVNPTTDTFLTIYASTEKSDWLIDVANKFNQSVATVNGESISVGIRAIPSGLAHDFIATGKYKPDVFIPSSEIFGEMLENATLAEKSIAGNVMGIVMSKKKNGELADKYGTIDQKAIHEGVLNAQIALGYTSPLSNEDGFNFILSFLIQADSSNPISDAAIEALRKFQDKVPFIAYDNTQLKAALIGGNLDAIIINNQLYANSPDLKSSYDFVPLGIRQDSPVYEIGELSDIKKQITSQFVAFCKNGESQTSATAKGFNAFADFAGASLPNATTILKAQEIYESEKNGSADITAVFVADVSGSMEGSPLLNLKASLNRATGIIGSNTNIGLVTFSDYVNIAVPIGKFDNMQKSYFSNAVKSMTAGGGTAMFDAVIVAQKMLLDAKNLNPNTKLMLFVLTDGETNRGFSFEEIENIAVGTRIPIYTIGYNYSDDNNLLQKLSNINEAAAMNADSDNVIYRLESLFNTQM